MVIILTFLLGAGFGLLAYMFKEAHADRVIEQDIFLPDLSESFPGLKLFFISDIHRRNIGGKILKEIKGKAELIVIGGDLLEKGVPVSRVKSNLLKLREAAPVYFIWGNNDYETDEAALSGLLAECGVTELKNGRSAFVKDGETFELIGLDDLSYRRPALGEIVDSIPAFSHRILLCHNPAIIRQIKREHRIALLLSGHTHGGQIRIFGFGPYEPGSLRYLPETVHLVSNGYGTTTLPLRLGAKAETHLLTIKAECR